MPSRHQQSASSEADTTTVAAAKGSLKPIIHKKGAAFDLSRPHKSRVSNFYLKPLWRAATGVHGSGGGGIVGNKKLLAAKFLLTYHPTCLKEACHVRGGQQASLAHL